MLEPCPGASQCQPPGEGPARPSQRRVWQVGRPVPAGTVESSLPPRREVLRFTHEGTERLSGLPKATQLRSRKVSLFLTTQRRAHPPTG